MEENKSSTKVEKYFIGAVKFFDVKKDFGYIASNNCNMSSPKYNQDFYVDSSSFIEEDAKKEGRIVVFKIHKQPDGKKRAIQVRRISKSEEDINLALSYYGDHEYIIYNDNRKINLYTKLYKPVKLVAEKVQEIIESDAERSPKRTLEHFTFFINHYKKEDFSEDRYLFDRDFSKDDKQIWVTLFSVFTDDERLELLMRFPSIARYFGDSKLLQKWIDAYLSEDKSLSRLKDIERAFKYIPEQCVLVAKEKIQMIADAEVKRIFAELSTRSDINRDELTSLRSLRHRVLSYSNDSSTQLLFDLHSYKELAGKKYDEETQKCLSSVRDNQIKAKIRSFRSNPNNTYSHFSFPDYVKALSDEEISKYKADIFDAVSFVLDGYIEKKDFSEAISLLRELTILEKPFVDSYKNRLHPLIVDYLSDYLRYNLERPYSIEHDFFPKFDDLTIIYNSTETEQIKQSLLPIAKGSTSLFVLSAICSESHPWLSVDEALALADNIIATWQFDTYKEFLESEPYIFENDIKYVEMIIRRVTQLIGSIPLKHFFDGTPIKDGTEFVYYSRNPERENCTFLINLKKVIIEDKKSSEWDKYIESRSVEDLIVLFDNDVIESLPDNIIVNLIGSITLDYIYGDCNHWYEKPSLKHPTYRKLFETTKSDLVSLIGRRLCHLEWTNDNIPLAVFLAELMSANKPPQEDYNAFRNWESSFKDGLNKLATNQVHNKGLTVVLWAVYFQTKASMSSFSELFAYLPPYVQIRCVKKLFQLIGQGKIKHTAESLYNLIGNGTKKMCFPLEITFAYLKIREIDTNATLNNNVMLQLLEGREDHMDWVGIRQMVTQCVGRQVPHELPDDYTNRKRNSYFNGIIKKIESNTIRVFVPYKMVDEYGGEKKYNNKYFQHSIEQIKLTFNENEYKFTAIPQGACYDFNVSYEVELFSIARAYNFHYNGLNNFIGFETKEEQGDIFCECRQSNNVDNFFGISFYWCGNKPCFRVPIRYRLPHEWEYYTILDFMRILNISADYTNRAGNITKYGHYIILSSYLKSFAKFYEHLSCRGCGKLMKPKGITNFTTRAVTEFSCANEQCKEQGKIVYLNHCFNKKKCNATIDSRDSKMCPNEQYICPECGACCSTENFKLRIQHLHTTGGYISDRLVKFVENDLGHWEKGIYFCYKCGKQMNEHHVCPDCGFQYKQ